MSSRSKHTKHSRSKRAAAGTQRRTRVITDFDNTMIPLNTAAMLVWYYLRANPHHEPVYRRMHALAALASPGKRAHNFAAYYSCLRKIPTAKRHELLSRVHVSERWLRAIKGVRLKQRATTVYVTILTRNCIDIVHEWVMQNVEVLRKHGIVVEAIIANGPLAGPQGVLVRERADLSHIDYIGFGQLLEAQKPRFVDRETIYIGDVHERLLKPFVREFILV